jgi:hypothetical protein
MQITHLHTDVGEAIAAQNDRDNDGSNDVEVTFCYDQSLSCSAVNRKPTSIVDEWITMSIQMAKEQRYGLTHSSRRNLRKGMRDMLS